MFTAPISSEKYQIEILYDNPNIRYAGQYSTIREVGRVLILEDIPIKLSMIRTLLPDSTGIWSQIFYM
jgi:hypothetical protein